MIVELTPRIKFVCDRCGKEEYPDAEGRLIMPHNVEFCARLEQFGKRRTKEGQVCSACLEEFWEFAENFFDEVNKEKAEQE